MAAPVVTIISLKRVRLGTIWELQSNNYDFVEGFSYGILFIHGDEQDTVGYDIVLTTDAPRTRVSFYNVPTLNDVSEFILQVLIPLHEVVEYTKDAPEKDQYIVWLRDPYEKDEANLIAARSPAFFQGLFTALNALGIPYEQVVLHKPFKYGQNFDISGMQLPTLEEFSTEQIMAHVD